MNERSDLVIRICGSAGDGSISAVEILNRAMAFMGFHIMNFDSYPAEIRGFGKSVGHTRISPHPVLTPGTKVDCLVSLNDQHAIQELTDIQDHGIIIYDSQPPDYVEEDCSIAGFIEPGWTGIGVPLREMSTRAVSTARSRNIVALGVICGIYHFTTDAFLEALKKRFSRKQEDVLRGNLLAFHLGYQYVTETLRIQRQFTFHKQIQAHTDNIIITSGNEAVAQAMLDAGLRLYAGYPITPATKIMEILAKELPARTGQMVQTEDEISAIGHVVGAGYSGKRAATATSGPGLCLMTEVINLAVQAEVPCVIIDSQRGGPSTGLPTKTEQSDLNLAVWGASGDSPRPVLAPTTVAECYSLTKTAFELAESFQTPVIVLLDFFLSNRFEDINTDSMDHASYGVFPQILAQNGETPYQRFTDTPSGISPRAYPGMAGLQHVITGLEHNERGFPDYEPANHRKMTEKRFRKMDTLLHAWPPPEPFGMEGDLDIGIISWGSSTGASLEALQCLQNQGIHCGGLFPRLIWPAHEEALNAFSQRCQKIVVVEMNHSGQYARLVEQVIHRSIVRFCHVYAGPMPADAIVTAIRGGRP